MTGRAPAGRRLKPDTFLRAGARRALASTTNVSTGSRVLALTFDDGPDPRLTPLVLDVLRHKGVRATFLLVAHQVRQHPALARRVAADGHEVGLHGDQHIDMRGTGLRSQYTALRRGRRDVESVLERPITWFRAPYGKQDPQTVVACRAAGMHPLMWSASAHDWQPDDIDSQLSHAEGGLRPGAIVLLHDGAAGLDNPPPPLPNNQPQLLDSLLAMLQDRELRPVTVSELCAAGARVNEPWFGSWLHH